MHQHSDVTLLAPARPPRILNQPIFFPCIRTIALCQDCMTKDGILIAGVKDAAVIVEPVVAIHGHNHWSIADQCLHQWSSLIAWQLLPAINTCPPCCLPRPAQRLLWARLGFSGVGQVCLQGNTIIPHEAIGQLPSGTITATRPTTTLRIWHAIHQCLCGKPWRWVHTSSLQVSFNSLDSRDRPTAPTVALLAKSRTTVKGHATAVWCCLVG
mmetsp:Transcript_116503/g.226608  ORF Transcript_116503/g.226608 Transcript_116503/m.226608 type:complete len:212 (+) Transcript_116503:381-1016(+)